MSNQTELHTKRALNWPLLAILLLGLLLSFLAAMSLRLSYEARRRSADAAAASQRLAAETQERLQAQQALRDEQLRRVEALESARRALLEAQLMARMVAWQLDPSAWVIWGLEKTGLAWDVVRIPPERQAAKLAA